MYSQEESLHSTVALMTDELIQQSTKLMMINEKIREMSLLLKQETHELDELKLHWNQQGQATLHKQRLKNKLEHKVLSLQQERAICDFKGAKVRKLKDEIQAERKTRNFVQNDAIRVNKKHEALTERAGMLYDLSERAHTQMSSCCSPKNRGSSSSTL
jgi:hypothetical protein